MILANEHVAAFLAGRNREALYRVHERPDPQSIELLLAKLADLGVPTPPVPDVLSPQAAAELAGEISRASRRVRRAVRPRPRGVPGARPARAQAGALRPAQPRPLGAREPGLLPLHLADPPLPRPRRPPRAAARARPGRRPAAGRPRRSSPSTPRRASARRRSSSTSPTTSASRGCSRTGCASAAGTSRGTGEIIGLIGSGLFVRFGEVFEGFLPARRLPGEFFELNPTGDGARRAAAPGARYRLGDPIEVRVESIARAEGKVELALGETAVRRPAAPPARPAGGRGRRRRRRA